MQKQQIHCPNCGALAERIYFEGKTIVQTSCEVCDYFLVSTLTTGVVLESYYTPGKRDALNWPQAASASRPLE